jgi:putative flavoprotein involved in K+ transport
MSYFLSQAGRDHVVLERRATLGGGWQDRWDSFCLVSPNWTTAFPGMPYDGPNPDAFMLRDEIAGRVARYATAVNAPVALETAVSRLSARPSGGFAVETSEGVIAADNVIVATGSFHVPRIPVFAAALPKRVVQLHSHDYRNDAALPAGAVLVVGSGQSGTQIVEELHEAGREVYLAVGNVARMPRRYRGRDIFAWVAELMRRGPSFGVTMPTVDKLPDPRMRFAGNPYLSGHGGGHDINLRAMASSGVVTLLGHLDGIDGERLRLAPDLPKNLAWADAFFGERLQPLIDRLIDLAGIDAPADDRPIVDFDPPVLPELDLAKAGISTVIWTGGYALDYGWIDLPIFGERGMPVHRRGVTGVPGLFFLGLLWQYNQASATLFGPSLDGPFIAHAMGLRLPVEDVVLV